MKGREGKGATSTDLLVCFPSRAHLTLMPKSICSPARSSEPNKRHLHLHRHHNNHLHHLKKSTTRGSGGGGAQGSPLLWARTKPMGSDISEPTSPKVTCAGQIKVRPKTSSSCKNWQSVMEEIEKIHNNNKKHKKRTTWVEALGFKKEIMQFLTCLRSIRFDFRCFGSFPEPGITTDDEDDDQEEDDHDNDNDETSKTVFSKWFMVLQENNNTTSIRNREENLVRSCDHDGSDDDDDVVPPPNALLLMRCRSAPAKSLLEEREAEEEKEEVKAEKDQEAKKSKLSELFMEEAEMLKKNKMEAENNLVVMRYDTDFYKLSNDIAKETWVVGGIRDPFSRSRSWKR